MRFSVQLLAIAATVLSFNATPQQAAMPLAAAVMSPTLHPAAATVDEEMREATVSADGQPTGTSPIAWVLAAGFLMLVALRRIRSGPLD